MLLHCGWLGWCFDEGYKCLKSLNFHNATAPCSDMKFVVHIFNSFEEVKSDGVFNTFRIFKNTVKIYK
jgi:hypothetical protein